METLFSDDGLFAPPGRSLQLVKLERSIDAQKLCCNNIAFVCEGKPPHAAELRCARCDSHRGWLPREALDFITSTTERIGAPAQPIILRDHSIGDHTLMEKKFDDTNRGALFKNDRKAGEKDADYSGTINFNGVECWLNAWIKTSKAGKKFMSLSVKPKEAPKAERVPFNDSIVLRLARWEKNIHCSARIAAATICTNAR